MHTEGFFLRMGLWLGILLGPSVALPSGMQQEAAIPALGGTASDLGGGSSGHHLLLRWGRASDVAEPEREHAFPRKHITFGVVTGCVVRVAYIVPSNRLARSNAVSNLQWALRHWQDWYREQMERNGFGPKTFRYETEADGVTPRIYSVDVSVTDDYLRGDMWGRTISAASAAGVPVWTSRQVWLLVPEAHVMAAGGGISGGTALGASFGSGDDAGVAMIGSDALVRFSPEYLTNNAGYAGKVVPELGPYSLVQNVSFPSFEGNTFSSVSSSVLGAGIHELSHGFGLPHNFRNDNNFNGNLMGNGLRGIRGNLYPERYRTDNTRVAFGSALALSVSRYFNPPRSYSDNTKPSLSVTTRGAQELTNGLLEIKFAASDVSGLHAAWLQLSGDLVAEMPLHGTSTNTAFQTAYYHPGQDNTFTVTVFDTQGNRRSVDSSIVPGAGNRAPQPFVTPSMPTAFVGQSVTLNAGSSTDPGGNTSQMQVEWDFDGDGVLDTTATTSKSRSHVFPAPGDYFVRARLTDSLGAQTLSTPVPIRVLLPALEVTAASSGLELSWPLAAAGFTLQSASNSLPLQWAPSLLPRVNAGNRAVVTITNPSGSELFRLAR